MFEPIYRVITNDVSDYVNFLIRIAHVICNHFHFKISFKLMEQSM
jgi:hypothetical protein